MDIILKPSTNWFQHNAVSARSNILITASFKNIVIYKFSCKTNSLDLQHVIPIPSQKAAKANGVCLYPLENEKCSRYLAALAEDSTLSIIDIETGLIIVQNQLIKKPKEQISFNSISWAHVKGEETVCIVGEKSSLTLWQPFNETSKNFVIDHAKKNLNVIEVLPHIRDEALIAANSVIFHVSLKDGSLINQFRGHEATIYCIKIFPSTNIPSHFFSGAETSDWRNNETKDGLIFASSDVNRNVYVWDFDAKQYICKGAVPISTKGQKLRSKGAKNQHVSLCWTQNQLIGTTISGEIIQFKLAAEMQSKLLSHPHTGAIFNLAISDEILYSFGHDRVINVLDLRNNSILRSEPTIGVSAASMAFSPHDANRLALGMQDGSIKLLNFASKNVNMRNFHYGISGKVHALSWHPEEESKLLFGTSDGQIGIVDVISGKITSYALYHQKACYKVEWALAVAPEKTGIEETWCAYSFGGRELLARSGSDLIKEPFNLHAFLGFDSNASTGFCLTEFSFSPDYEFLAVGDMNGEIRVFDRDTLTCRATILRIRKTIQHILWKPYMSPGDILSDNLPENLSQNLSGITTGSISELSTENMSQNLSGIATESISELSIENVSLNLTDDSGNATKSISEKSSKNLSDSKNSVENVSGNATTKLSYTIAVASGESVVFIFDLDDILTTENTTGPTEPTKISKSTKELIGHSSRLVWLSWSTNGDGRLASASYDNTVQVWNTVTGEPIGNYGFHNHRVFRVEFTPFDSDRLISFAEENTIHAWNVSKLQFKTPSDTYLMEKQARKKAQKQLLKEELSKAEVLNGENDSPKTALPIQTRSKLNKKATFPLLHNYTSRRHSFHHMCILCLLEVVKSEKDVELEKEGFLSEDISESLEEDLPTLSNGGIHSEEDFKSKISEALKKNAYFMPADHEMPTVDDVCFYLNFFGDLPQMNEIFKIEMQNHEATENVSRANLMSVWQGSLESRIKWAANNKCLDPVLISMAPQVSYDLWQFACESYAEQLNEEKDPLTAATYLVTINKDQEAVDLLAKNKLYREALVIAKYKLGFNKQVIDKVLVSWANLSIYEGNFELAAILFLKIGSIESAARLLARRNEARTLIMSAKLYAEIGSVEMALSTAVLAFQNCAAKNEFTKFEPIIKDLPQLRWCKCLNVCKETLLNYLNDLKTVYVNQENNQHNLVDHQCNGENSQDIKGVSDQQNVVKDQRKEANDQQEVVNKQQEVVNRQRKEVNDQQEVVNKQQNGVNKQQNEVNDQQKVVNKQQNGVNIQQNVDANQQNGVINEHMNESSKQNILNDEIQQEKQILSTKQGLLSSIRENWRENGLEEDSYNDYSEHITENLKSPTLPNSTKHLWHLLSIHVSQMILDQTNWALHLEDAFKSLHHWDKNDHKFYFTHLLLPSGIIEAKDFYFKINAENEKKIFNSLCEQYVISEAMIILDVLENDQICLPWNVEMSNGIKSGNNVEYNSVGNVVNGSKEIRIENGVVKNAVEDESKVERINLEAGNFNIPNGNTILNNAENLIPTSVENNTDFLMKPQKIKIFYLFKTKDEFFGIFNYSFYEEIDTKDIFELLKKILNKLIDRNCLSEQEIMSNLAFLQK